MVRSPRSHRATVFVVTPSAAASACWVRASCRRRRRSSSPVSSVFAAPCGSGGCTAGLYGTYTFSSSATSGPRANERCPRQRPVRLFDVGLKGVSRADTRLLRSALRSRVKRNLGTHRGRGGRLARTLRQGDSCLDSARPDAHAAMNTSASLCAGIAHDAESWRALWPR
jgi:hypothetical protein